MSPYRCDRSCRPVAPVMRNTTKLPEPVIPELLGCDTGQAVPRLELEESGGEVVVGLDDRGVRFLPVTGSVFAVSCTAQHFPCPALGVLPLLL